MQIALRMLWMLAFSLLRMHMCTELHAIFADIGRLIAVLHDGGLVHGDLTTSNMMVRQPDKAVVSFKVQCSEDDLALTKHA